MSAEKNKVKKLVAVVGECIGEIKLRGKTWEKRKEKWRNRAKV